MSCRVVLVPNVVLFVSVIGHRRDELVPDVVVIPRPEHLVHPRADHVPNLPRSRPRVGSHAVQPFEQFLQERLFEPLNMPDTGFSIPDEKLDRFAACYERDPNKELKLQDDPETSRYRNPPTAPSGAGGLLSTMRDYSHFCDMLLQRGAFNGKQLISRATLALMTRNHLGHSSLAQMAVGGFSETSNEGVGFGLGFASTMDAAASGTVGEGDFYWGGLASTLFWVDPVEDLYAIFMAQLIPSSTFNFRGQIKNIVYGSLCEGTQS